MKDNSVSGAYRKKIQKAKKDEQEFGLGKKDFVVCSDCNAVYSQKSWKHGFTDYKRLSENKSVNFTLCPACQMIKDNKFEGKVIFENIPAEIKGELLANIKNTGERARERDPMDRIIKSVARSTQHETFTIEVTTTENQLARNIVRQAEKAFKGAKSEIQWSKEESAAIIKVKFS